MDELTDMQLKTLAARFAAADYAAYCAHRRDANVGSAEYADTPEEIERDRLHALRAALKEVGRG